MCSMDEQKSSTSVFLGCGYIAYLVLNNLGYKNEVQLAITDVRRHHVRQRQVGVNRHEQPHVWLNGIYPASALARLPASKANTKRTRAHMMPLSFLTEATRCLDSHSKNNILHPNHVEIKDSNGRR